MPPSPASARAVRARIQEHLYHKIVNSNSVADAYIRYQDIYEAWSGHDTIHHALYPTTLSANEVECFRASLLRFLSILVYIDAHEFWSDFRKQCLDENGNLRYKDSELPVTDQGLPPLGSFPLRERFLQAQYLFVPAPLTETSAIQPINERLRLPFESVSKNVFAGAFGVVDKVGISPFYLTTTDGNQNPHVKYVACKRFHAATHSLPHINSKTELDNLQVLKESITSHDHIRKHLAILSHKGEHLILLPWADHLDLEIFLLEGHNFVEQRIYDFKLRFSECKPGNMIEPICTQMYHIADALRWLHEGVIGGTHRNRVHFAHMDMKPNNILIDNDPTSIVGRWVLTDFGISAVQEDGESPATNLVSVRDLYENFTINTAPPRQAGAYQAPEVEPISGRPSDRNNERKAGRRGDIWSFGCILAEVLAFALNQKQEVMEFRNFRKARFRNDYFYERAHGETLGTLNQIASFKVRQEVVKWLRNLPNAYVYPNRVIDCCVETILDILVCDGSARPKAQDLVKMMDHVARHVVTARRPNDLRNCPLEKNSQRMATTSQQRTQMEPEPMPRTLAPRPSSMARKPSIKRTTTDGEEMLFNAAERSSIKSPVSNGSDISPQSSPSPRQAGLAVRSSPPQPEGTFVRRKPVAMPLADSLDKVPGIIPPRPSPKPSVGNDQSSITRMDDVNFKSDQESLLRPDSPQYSGTPSLGGGPAQGLAITFGSNSPGKTSDESRRIEFRRFLSRDSNLDSHGILESANHSRVAESHIEITLTEILKAKILASSFCPSGHRVAYLLMNKARNYQIRVFQLSVRGSGFWCHIEDLYNAVNWERIALAGENLAIWGSSRSGAKFIMIRAGQSGLTNLDSATYSWLSTLRFVSISRHGSVVLVCPKQLHFLNLADPMHSTKVISPRSDHAFTHAAFNDDGTLLYAWTFGRPNDHLYIWRIDEVTRNIVLPADSEGSYQSRQQGSPNTTLIPYKSYLGCVIHAQNDSFFPAQIRSTQRGSNTELPKNNVFIPRTEAACMYGDHSLLTVERGLMHTHIKEHRIIGGSTHLIEKAGKEDVAKLRYAAEKITGIRVASYPDSEDLAIVMCTIENKILVVPIISTGKRTSLASS